jgi:hypothetical protein
MKYLLTEFGKVGQINAEVSFEENTLTLRYSDLPSGISWPVFREIRRADNLWESTCFECFLGRADESAYIEINLSPNGAWNCYAFDDYRTGMQSSDVAILQSLSSDDHELTACLEVYGGFFGGTLTLGLSAVIDSGVLSYYAITHGDRPDFHDRSCHLSINPALL